MTGSVNDVPRGDFMELEVCLRTEQTLEEGNIIAQDLMRQLDITETDLIKTSYLEME